MTTADHSRVIEALRADMSMHMSEQCFQLFDVLLCGHTSREDQMKFLMDAHRRGILSPAAEVFYKRALEL